MVNKSKWIIAGIIAVALIVGLMLGAEAVTLLQRTMWGYPPGYAANFIPSQTAPAFSQMQGYQGYPMPGPMMRGGPQGGGPMMYKNHMGRGPRGFGSGMMTPGMRRGFGLMPGGGVNLLTPIVAEQLDMTTAELTTELQLGKTVADLAKEKDASLDNIIDALLSPHTERMQLMVENGVMTQEQVEVMTTAMKARVAAQLSSPLSNGPGACPGLGDTDGDGLCDFGGRGPRGGWGPGMMWR